jgi:RNA-directed DNA polymerase
MGVQQSELLIVPLKPGNPDPRDSVEGRGNLVVEPEEGKMSETLSSGSVTTRLQRIAELARKDPARVFTSIAHVIDVEWMREAYRRTRKSGAVGIDGKGSAEFAVDLEANLRSMVEALQRGNYRPPAVRRTYIPKGDGRRRPIGIPTFIDKVMQRAVAMLLEAIYEQDFHPDSYGFRPGRSAHAALIELQKRPTYWEYCWVIEADIEGFFDALDHAQLRSFLDQRVRDGVIRKAIDKWLCAGVLEDGALHRSKMGTPQGGVISPLLANIYLHYVLDVWLETEVKPRVQTRAKIIRYADDFVLLFGCEEDARKVFRVLPKRLSRYRLSLHREKTRLIPFTSPARLRGNEIGPGTFVFLGFTHFWARSRRGRYVVKQKTSKERFSRSLHRAKDLCRYMRHWCLRDQHQRLKQLLRGHCNYFGITGNADAIRNYRYEVERIWGRSLARRNNRRFAWQRFVRILERFPLPHARTVHSVCPSEPAT